MYRKSVLVVSRNLSFSKFIFKRIIFDPAYLQGFSLRKYSKLRAYPPFFSPEGSSLRYKRGSRLSSMVSHDGTISYTFHCFYLSLPVYTFLRVTGTRFSYLAHKKSSSYTTPSDTTVRLFFRSSSNTLSSSDLIDISVFSAIVYTFLIVPGTNVVIIIPCKNPYTILQTFAIPHVSL